MEISWLGHSCFLIKGKEKVIITDPYHPSVGYSLGEPKVDIVTISHFHPGHSYVEGVSNKAKQIKGPGEYEIGEIFITGIATFHDSQKGKIKGKNTIYIIEMDGITLCHLGDLGHPLTPQLVEELGAIDILFSPVGETSAISVDTAVEIVRQINPHIVIPMHYRGDVDKFLKRMGVGEVEPKPKLLVTSLSLLPGTKVEILTPKS